jgi:uncharacterized protein
MTTAEPGAGAPMDHLGVSDCWALLRSAPVCRVAVCTADGPQLLPMNHVVDAGTLVLRTAEGTTFAEAGAAGALVAVEADGYDEGTGTAWSVVARGRVRQVTRLHDLVDLEQVPVAPWHAAPKHRFLRIEPDEVTGRRFPVAAADYWRSALGGARRSPAE